MSDDRLRELRRRAADDPEAARELLSAGVRSGDLVAERVGVLAYLGDPAAREVWESLGEAPPPTWEEVHASLERVSDPASRRLATERRLWARWAAGLSRLGREASVRIALAAARASQSTNPEVTRAAQAVDEWLAGDARDVGDYEGLAERLSQAGDGDPGSDRLAAAAAVRAAGSLTPRVRGGLRRARPARAPSQPGAPQLAHERSLARVRAHLGAWALGA